LTKQEDYLLDTVREARQSEGWCHMICVCMPNKVVLRQGCTKCCILRIFEHLIESGNLPSPSASHIWVGRVSIVVSPFIYVSQNHPEMNNRPVEAAVLRRQSHPIIANLPVYPS
jgi:hypothetical protein